MDFPFHYLFFNYFSPRLEHCLPQLNLLCCIIAMIAPGLIPSLSGRTILVRPGEEEDSAVAALRSHPEIRRYLPWRPAHFSVEEARKLRIHEKQTKHGSPSTSTYLPTELPPLSKTKFAGMASITHMIPEFKSCEMGILVSPECFRGGFITSANNVGMRGWLDKAGATLEGTTREDVCLMGGTVKPRLEQRINRAIGANNVYTWAAPVLEFR
ncbi:hypothetical protein K438DRAFT_1835165 [Mycena galopus ATCC 62051]|nr:hypothetical protein K438DRAFT_1835165 [Mycena galopus ATCC 62051]